GGRRTVEQCDLGSPGRGGENRRDAHARDLPEARAPGLRRHPPPGARGARLSDTATVVTVCRAVPARGPVPRRPPHRRGVRPAAAAGLHVAQAQAGPVGHPRSGWAGRGPASPTSSSPTKRGRTAASPVSPRGGGGKLVTTTMTFGTGAVTRSDDTICDMRVRRAIAILLAGLATATTVGTVHAFDAVDAVYPESRRVALPPPPADAADARPTVAVLLGPAGANVADVLAPYETL